MADKKETKAPVKKAPAKKVTKAVEPVVEKAPVKGSGRPTQFTPETRERICELIKLGCSYVTAAETAGISKSLLYHWMNKGMLEKNRIKAGLEPIPEEAEYFIFLENIERKKEEFIASMVASVTKAGVSGDWRAAAWMLEKVRPSEYGKTEQIIHTGADGGDIKVSINVGDLENKIQMILSKRNKPVDE